MAAGNRATPEDYVITLRGSAGAGVVSAFPEFSVSISDDVTVLKGRIEDQAALHGLLQRMQDLGLEILEVRSPDR